jgi:hypothetical protein
MCRGAAWHSETSIRNIANKTNNNIPALNLLTGLVWCPGTPWVANVHCGFTADMQKATYVHADGVGVCGGASSRPSPFQQRHKESTAPV